MISKFKDWGLPVSDEIYFCENLDKVNRQILKMTAKREKLNYESNKKIEPDVFEYEISILSRINELDASQEINEITKIEEEDYHKYFKESDYIPHVE